MRTGNRGLSKLMPRAFYTAFVVSLALIMGGAALASIGLVLAHRDPTVPLIVFALAFVVLYAG